MKYRKKPVVVEAIQLTNSNVSKVLEWMRSGNRVASAGYDDEDKPFIVIETLEGSMTAIENDWIIKGVKGEFYPCKADIFEMTYEKAEAPHGDK